MRLLVVARQWPTEAPIGRAVAFARLVERLGERHRVRLVLGYATARHALPDEALGVDLRGRSPAVAALALWRASGAAARRFGPDVVLTSGLELPHLRVPTVAVVRDLVGTGWESTGAGRRAVQRASLRRYARIVVPTLAARQQVLSAGASAWRIERIPEPVPLPPRAPPPARDPAVLVHPGRVLPGKAQHLSIDAVSRLGPSEKERIALHVVGPVGDRRYFDQLRVAARGQPVHFHPDDPIEPWMRRAHLVLYPTSIPEGFADAAVQAMAHERPVIWADHPGVRESVGDVGIAVRPDHVEALRAEIRAALSDPVALRELGRRGRQLVAQRYAWDRLAPRWEEALTSAKRVRRALG